MAIRTVTLKIDDEKVDFNDFMGDLNDYLEDDVADGTAEVVIDAELSDDEYEDELTSS